MDDLLTAAEAMAVLRCKRTYLTERADEIGVVRRGGRLLFYRSDLERWNQRHYIAPKAERDTPRSIQSARPSLLPGPARINPVTKVPYGALGR